MSMKHDWEYKKLGEVATYINGYAFKPEEWMDNGLPIIRIQNLNNDNAPFNYYNGEIPSKYIINTGDLLISWSASLGAYIWKGEKAYLNQHIFKVEFDKSDISKFYLKLVVESKLAEMSKSTHGATMKHITKKDFDNVPIPLPPLSTQQSIVSELDSLSKIIADCKETLKDYDALEQSIFYDMFGDPVKNEKGWEVKKLGEVCDVKGGYAFKSENFKNIGIPILRIGNINSGYFTQNNMVFWDEDDTLEKYAIYPGEMVMSLTGTVGKDDYGNLCILGSDYKKYYLNQRNAKLQLHNDLDKWMLFFLLKNKEIKGILTGVSRGVRQANIANRDIENLKIILPPLHYQQQFASKIEAIEQMKEETKKALQEAETLFQARMDYWFN